MPVHELDNLLILFVSTLKSAKLYDVNHPLLKGNLVRLSDVINNTIQEDGEFSFAVKNWYIYIGGERLRIHAMNFAYVKTVLDMFKKKDIGGFVIKEELDTPQLLNFLRILNTDGLKKSHIEKELENSGISDKINILPLIQKGEILDPKQRVKAVYFETIGLVKNIAMSKEVRKMRTKLSVGVYYLIDTLKTSEQLLLGLTVVKNYDNYLYNHSVNVAILSLSMGVRLGLKTSELLALGQAALLHDIGMSTLPKEIVAKPSVLTPDEWDIIRQHPLRGGELLCELLGVTDESAPVIVATLEHQRNYDRSGYPEFIQMEKQSFLSRIIRITDFYDAVTTPRVYSPIPMSTSEALRHLIQNSGKLFDPVLVKYFVNLVGIYPMGTLVFLNTGEWGIVIGQSKSKENFDKPIIQIIKDASGNDVKPQVLDLAFSEKFIMKSDTPWKYGIDPAQYFI